MKDNNPLISVTFIYSSGNTARIS